MLTLLYIVGGIAGLYFGGEWLVNASTAMGRRLGISPLVIGLTVVAFGTSCPELATSLHAARRGATDLAFGNVVGSNIANVGLVLGVGALLTRIEATRLFMLRDVPVLLGSGLLTWYMASDGVVDQREGTLLLLALAAYLGLLVYGIRQGDSSLVDEVPDQPTPTVLRALLGVVAGIALLLLGAHSLVHGSIVTARTLGISERVIGLTLVAIGTSLPELASTVVACLKGQDDMAMGNIVGSNIFNVLAILGTTSAVHSVQLDVGPLPIEMGVMLGLSALVPILTARKPAGRPAGLLLLCLYVTYLASLATRGA